MDEGTLGVHKIELVIDAGEDLSDGRGVGDHAHSTHNLGQVTTWDNSWWLVIDTAFETSWAPVDKLDSSFGFDSSNRSIYIFWYNITSVHHTTGHVFTVSWITFGHHRGRFKSGVSDFSNGELFMISFFSRNNWSVR